MAIWMRKLSAMQYYLNVGARDFDLWECTYHFADHRFHSPLGWY
jgi:hypothetical protein